MLKDWGSFQPPLFIFTWLCEPPLCSALVHKPHVSCGSLGSCLPCTVLVCPRCEVMPSSWKLVERSLNWNRLKTQTRTITEVWLTYSNAISPTQRLCVWTPELLADKTWFCQATSHMGCDAQAELFERRWLWWAWCAACSSCALREMVIFLDAT